MAYDGLFFRSLAEELRATLLGGKIDKIHQPEKDELVLHIRADAHNYKLKLSADASIPYITLSEEKKENPMQAPMFCMLLRKHLSGGRITALNQIGLERIIEIEVESRDELGELSTKVLCIEVMGKHSNIILYQKEDLRILESIKRISAAMSRSRQVYPGIPYTPPPFDKRNLLLELPSVEELKEVTLLAPKWLVKEWQGFSPSGAQWLLYGTGLPADLQLSLWQSDQLNAFYDLLSDFRNLLLENRFTFSMFYEDDQRLKPFEVLCFMPANMESDGRLKGFDSSVSLVNAFFGSKDHSNRLDQKGAFMKKSLTQRLEKSYVKRGKLQEDFASAEHSERYKILGELILANLYRIEKGMSKVEVENYYEDPATLETIELDLRLSPSENAQRYFKRYNKAKTGQIEILKQLEDTEMEIAYLEQVLTAIENSSDSENLDEIRTELADQGYLKRKVAAYKAKKIQLKYLKYESSEGFEILVGKNNYQNDYLTLKLASNKDLWLHTKVIPGSHVIVRTSGEDVPEQTLYEAALLAAYHSKGRHSGQVPVDYTLVKNVSKPSGAKPGMVIYQTNKTLYVTPSEAEISEIKKL